MKRIVLLLAACLAFASSVSAQTLSADRFRINTVPCVTTSGADAASGGNNCDTYVKSDGTLWVKTGGAWVQVATTASGAALTKVDDTNVTLALGGAPATALVNAASLTLGWTGTLGLTRGGSAKSLAASNGGIVWTDADSMEVLAATATAGQMLRSGAGATPAWSTATWPATVTQGDLLTATGANAVGVTADVAVGQVLASGGVGAVPAYTASPSLTSIGGAANLELNPIGDLITDPAGNDVLPEVNYDINIGALSKKYLTLHAAELWVETLVAQDTIATIGGRVLVAPTTVLTVDLGDGAGDTTITVKHNEMASGDRVYMESNGKVEFMSIDSGAGGGAGAYTYTVSRDLDGSGRNVWYAGDAVLNTGTTGDGFIDLYSVDGVLSGAGPTIVGNVRTGATYNNLAPRWAIGNLNGLYGYATTIYGSAFGDSAETWMAMDSTNGFRVMHGAAVKTQIDASGNATFTGTVNATAGYFGDSSNRVAIEAAGINVGNTGSIRGGQTAYATGAGFWLGYSGAAYKFSIGNGTTTAVNWDGADLLLYGDLQLGTVNSCVMAGDTFQTARHDILCATYEALEGSATSVGSGGDYIFLPKPTTIGGTTHTHLALNVVGDAHATASLGVGTYGTGTYYTEFNDDGDILIDYNGGTVKLAFDGANGWFTAPGLGVNYNTSIFTGESPYRFVIYESSSGYLPIYLDSEYDNALASVNIRMRTAGTPVNAVTITGNGLTTLRSAADGTLTVNEGEDDAASKTMIAFYRVSDLQGTITTQNAVTAYNTSSDARLKENPVQTRYGREHLAALRVVDFTFIGDTDKNLVTGLMAQDVFKVYPLAVTKPATDDGTWMIDYGKFTPLLIRGWQDHEARIAALEARIK